MTIVTEAGIHSPRMSRLLEDCDNETAGRTLNLYPADGDVGDNEITEEVFSLPCRHRFASAPEIDAVTMETTVKVGALLYQQAERSRAVRASTSLQVGRGAPAGNGRSTCETYLRCPCSSETRLCVA